MPPSEPSLSAVLKAEIAAWQALLNVLAEEERALVDGEADRLAQLNASKLSQLQNLGKLASARQTDLLAAGCAADHAGMENWLAQYGGPESLDRWQELCDLEGQARAMNERIGALIELRLASTRQALNVLVHAATHQNGLYDQAGLAVAARTGKPLTAA